MNAFLLALTWPTVPAKPTIAAVALFKNGFAVVARQVEMTSTQAKITDLPTSSLGTLWVIGQDGLKVQEVVYEMAEAKAKQPAASLDEMLQANLGKAVQLYLADKQSLSGKLVSASGTIVVLETEGGTVGLAKAQVVGVSGMGLEGRVDRTQPERALRIKTDRAGKIVLLSLERGATWVPSYAVDVTDAKKLRIVGKATILNDLDDFAGIEARLITGFPNVPYAGVRDPLVSGASVDQFLQAFGGGFGGQAAAPMMQNQMYDRRERADAGWTGNLDIPDLETMQAEDLFMYRLPGVNLKKSERGYYLLFAAESEYENIYTWDIPDGMVGGGYRGLPEGPGDVWNTLVFKNTSPLPFTTAPATTFKAGDMLGQDLMRYTSVGAEARLRITKAMEIRAESQEEEIERVRLDPNRTNAWVVTMRGALEVRNRKAEAVKLRITKELTGEFLSAEGSPQVTRPLRGLRDANPRATLEWLLDIPAREVKKLTYSYKVIVNQ